MASLRLIRFALSIASFPLFAACGDGDGGDDTTPTATNTSVAPGPTTTAPVTTSAPTTGTTTSPEPNGDAAWAAAYAAFQANCDNGFCHGSAEFQPQLVGDEAMVKTSASGKAAKIIERINLEATNPLVMPPSSSNLTLTAEEKAAIETWAAGI